METYQEFELLFDRMIESELADRQIDLEHEILRANPELEVRLGRSKAKGMEHQRDGVPVITAAALAPLTVPIVIKIVKRTLPHTSAGIFIEKGANERTVIRMVRKEA